MGEPETPPDSEQAGTRIKTNAEERIGAFLASHYPLPLPDAKLHKLDAADVASPTSSEALAVAEGTASPTSWAMAAAARAIVSHDARFAKVLFGVEQSKTVEDVGPDDELIA
jgi:hypothetical protein